MEELKLEYFVLDNAINKVKEQALEVQIKQNQCFTFGEKYFLDYKRSIEDLKKYYQKFLDAYEDWTMEQEQKAYEDWKEDQKTAEKNYYNEVEIEE